MVDPPDPDKPIFADALLIEDKYDYVTRSGKYKDRVEYPQQLRNNCIICGIIDETAEERYEIYRNDKFILYLNLFPYTSGHVLISPLQHLTEYEDFPEDLVVELAVFSQKVIRLLKQAMDCKSVNVGYNQGPDAGGSIKHWHMHIVPRYPRELNFFEIIAHTKPTVMSLDRSLAKLKKYVQLLE